MGGGGGGGDTKEERGPKEPCPLVVHTQFCYEGNGSAIECQRHTQGNRVYMYKPERLIGA